MLQDILQKYSQSILEKDLEGFCSLYDDNVLVYDMWQQWTYKGINEWKKNVHDWFSSLGELRDKVSFDDIEIVEKQEMALVTAIVRFAAIDQQAIELRFLQNRFSWVLCKKENGWKIIHQHSSSPIDFETMKPILEKS